MSVTRARAMTWFAASIVQALLIAMAIGPTQSANAAEAAAVQQPARVVDKRATAATQATAAPAAVASQTPAATQASTVIQAAATVQLGVTDAPPSTVRPSARWLKSTAVETNVKMTPAAIERAEVSYKQQIEDGQQVGAALNNLAVLAVHRGDEVAAKGYFEKALATDDPHKGRYAYNYSRFLASTDPSAAVHWARAAVDAAPDSMAANEQLASLLAQTHPEEVLPFAGTLLSAGHTDLATRCAMASLVSGTRPAAEKTAWLILIGERVAKEVGVSDEATKAVAGDLEALQADPDIGAGSTQLRSVIIAPPATAADTSWWRAQSNKLPDNTNSGRVVMRNVLLAVGEARSSTDPKVAESYFDAAIQFGDRGPDPNAFLRLVELYASPNRSNDLSKLAALLDQYQRSMFQEKGDAYSRGDWPLIYQMHVALGMTYARLGVWTSEPTYQNAIFQLSHAMDAARQVNNATSAAAQRIALPPVAVDLLARGYETTGQPALAAKARVDGAFALHEIDHVPDSKEVFRSMTAANIASLDQASRARYERLRTSLGV